MRRIGVLGFHGIRAGSVIAGRARWRGVLQSAPVEARRSTSSVAIPSEAAPAEADPVDEAAQRFQKHGGQHTVLIDGSFLMFRSYHGMAGRGVVLTDRNGRDVSGVFAFTRALAKILRHPQFSEASRIVLVLDGRRNFRRELHADYKGHRAKLPEALAEQMPLMQEASHALGIPSVRADTYEADDLIAAYSATAARNGDVVTIVAQDKDLYQLVRDHVRLFDPVSENFVYAPGVWKKFGTAPEHVAQVQALTGDPSDNIPGVPGIGTKTAAKLILDAGGLEALLREPDRIENRSRRNKILLHRAAIELSLSLTTLREDAPLPVPYQTLLRTPVDRPRLVEFLDRYNFKSLVSDLARGQLLGAYPSSDATAASALKKVKLTRGRPSSDANTAAPSTLPPTTATGSGAAAESISSSPRNSSKVEEDGSNSANNNAVAVHSSSNNKETEEGREYTRFPFVRTRIEPAGVTVVDTRERAQEVLRKLLAPDCAQAYHACDTEVVGLDLKEEGPYALGSKVICASVYAGPQFDFGNGPRLWIDNLDAADGVLAEFRPYFGAAHIRKVWHNYSFDRAVLWRAGIDVQGFGGDTMHMARLWDAARTATGGYSLEALSTELLDGGASKRNMKDRFGHQRVKKDGTPGKEVVIPELDALQRGEHGVDMQSEWIDYSTLDAEATWKLREFLGSRLSATACSFEPNVPTMLHFYERYWRPFGEMLTDMERAGVRIDTSWLAKMEAVAKVDAENYKREFLQWAGQFCDDAKYMNPGSDAQIRQLFFAPVQNGITGEWLPADRTFKVENVEGYIEEGKKKPKKNRDIVISGLGLKSAETTVSGWPAASSSALRALAGQPFDDPPHYGSAFKFFSSHHGETGGAEACRAIDRLLEMGATETLLNNFLVPLQQLPDEHGRIHASLNLNTETGRLSCRRPNLQNQPALEKDRYQIRKAYTCEPHQALLVADYGQLELRLLAHMTNCKSMLEAFAKGGDFHSRTAMGMYPHVMKAVEAKQVLLEWDSKKNGKAPLPLLKDVFASERRKAKTLNFSIAYGKTAMGLARDWDVSRKEAEDTLNLWFSDRPEVRKWQELTIANAHRTGYTTTLMGRRRPLPLINSANASMRKHSERAAINTPIQGGAADIVMCAMLKVHHDDVLRDMGWRMLLQVHDELILEGPADSREKALARLKWLMEHPLDDDLLVALTVDAKTASTWFEAK